MATIADLAGVIQKNEAMYGKIAQQQSLALSKVADLQFAGVGESLRRIAEVQNRQMAELGRQVAAMTDISKLIDPSIFSIGKLVDPAIFSVGAQMRLLVDSMKVPAIDISVLTSVSGVLKQFEGYRFAIDSQLSSIFQDLAEGALASLRTYPFATTAAAATAGVWQDDLDLDDESTAVSTALDEAGGRRWPTLPAVPVSALLSLFAAACFALAYSSDRFLPEDVQVDLRTLAVGLLLLIITAAVLNK